MKYFHRLVLCLCVVVICSSCGAGLTENKVLDVTSALPDTPTINVVTPNRLLNDLMLSPFWKVEKERDGSFVANARSIGQDWPSKETGSFLFAFVAEQRRELLDDYRIRNRYLDGHDSFSSLQITVMFCKPDLKRIALGIAGQDVNIPVYESFGSEISDNSWSSLAFKLSDEHEVYVVLREQGSSLDRKTTLDNVEPVIAELSGLAAATETYRVEERYAAFFERFFAPPLKAEEIKQFPGNQDRDTICGYFRANADTEYAGINVKVSHPVYCPNEGTRTSSRLAKAEYLGRPYQGGDVLFFSIEDNAVYLSGEYDQRFGTFSGKESFEGDIEVLNDKDEVLIKTKGRFKGWQR